MGRKCLSVDVLNDFLMDNLRPYAWCNLWEETIPDYAGMFYFNMCARPNTYARTNSFYRSGIFWEDIPSSNTLELPSAEFHQSYVISIPMLKGDSIKDGKVIDQHPTRKFKYWNYLANQAIRSIELLDLDEYPDLVPQEIFGTPKDTSTSATGWEKVDSYIAKAPRPEWSFI